MSARTAAPMSALGSSCGVCLRLVGESECPSTDTMERLPNCDQLHAVDEYCEGDGECETSPTANSCNGNGDVYMRCTTPSMELHQPPWPPPAGPTRPPPPRVPPSPPQPPLLPMAECSALCDAGAECGVCLRLVAARECPATVAVVDRLPHCVGLRPGDLCEGDGECSTSATANNCHGHRDVYVRDPCVPAAVRAGDSDLLHGPLIACISAALLLLLILAGVANCRWRARHRLGGVARRGGGGGAATRSGTRTTATATVVELEYGGGQGSKAEALVVPSAL